MSAVKSQYKNQRLFRPGKQRRQQHLLEVSIRRDKERAIRFKAVSWFLFKFIVFSAVCAGLWFGGREGFRRYVWENPYFFLNETQVHTDGTLTREQILVAAGVTDTMNFFQLNLDKVRGALEALPQVEHVELDRGLPNKLSIDISERQPIAWLTDKPEIDPTATDKAFLVDSRGYIMTSRKRRLDFIHLPMISGVVLEDFCAGQKANTLEIQAALELIRLNADSLRWQIRSVDVSKGYCLIVTDRGRAKVTFGLDEIDRQLTRFYRILDDVEPKHLEIQTVNLLIERNIPVTFVDDNQPEPPPETSPVKPPDKTPPKLTAAASPAPRAGGFVKPEDKTRPTPAATPVRRAVPAAATPKRDPAPAVKKPFRT
ncbi:MAG TPA: FtsQ-type POTRA domain-containing protein [Chthoniobacteraceae bacterium]|jgi:cell division protein FtsQ|nr:FtsQ-type POTRA domain-containing protein [Chthoniobacteraceae bacterium]